MVIPMSPEQSMEKPAWRKFQRQRWKESCPDDRAAACAALASHLTSWLAGRPGRPIILWYSPLDDEPDLRALTTACRADGWPVALPKVEPGGLGIFRWDGNPADLTPGAFGILEPDPDRCQRVGAADIGLAIIPGLAFDPATGIRLGRGAGYYDRLLARPGFAAVTIGVAAPWHLATPLPCEAHDRPMDLLATATGMIDIDARR